MTTPTPLSGTDGQLMVMAAHRYCLGRHSYIVPSCIEWMEAYWGLFEQNTRHVIVRDTVDHLIESARFRRENPDIVITTTNIDDDAWARFVYRRMDAEGVEFRQMVRDRTRHLHATRGVEWPLAVFGWGCDEDTWA